MKLKKFLSAALALAMSLSLSVPAFAVDDEHRTEVVFDGTGEEEYFLTVPASLKPGADGTVTLRGTWASNRTFSVSADKTVEMTGSLGGSQTLDITFDGISLSGNNEVEVKEEKQVAVADITALFGEWSGTFYYNVNGAIEDWSSKVTLRNVTSAEYDLLCDATNEKDSLMHWEGMYAITDTLYNQNASSRIVRGGSSLRYTRNNIVPTYSTRDYGYRPAFDVTNTDVDLKVGTMAVMGTLYVGDEPVKVPTNTANGGNITNYDRNNSGVTSKITLGEALDDSAYQVKAIYVGNGVFVCDREMLNYITWNQINAALS